MDGWALKGQKRDDVILEWSLLQLTGQFMVVKAFVQKYSFTYTVELNLHLQWYTACTGWSSFCLQNNSASSPKLNNWQLNYCNFQQFVSYTIQSTTNLNFLIYFSKERCCIIGNDVHGKSFTLKIPFRKYIQRECQSIEKLLLLILFPAVKVSRN